MASKYVIHVDGFAKWPRSRRANSEEGGVRQYAALTRNEAQRRYWAFYEAVKKELTAGGVLPDNSVALSGG
jgi:hypothetical protein